MIQAKVLSTTQRRGRNLKPFMEALRRMIYKNDVRLLPCPLDQAAGVAAICKGMRHERVARARFNTPLASSRSWMSAS